MRYIDPLENINSLSTKVLITVHLLAVTDSRFGKRGGNNKKKIDKPLA
ncbi:hypothetical protein [Paenibacillus sp. FSL K6-0108]